MNSYVTRKGLVIDLDRLSTRERRALLRILEFAGPLHSVGDEEYPATAADPVGFEATAISILRQELTPSRFETSKAGELGAIIDDLVLRVALRRGTVDDRDLFDPTAFLRKYRYERCADLRDFARQTGIGAPQASRILRGEGSLSLAALTSVARKLGYAFDARPISTVAAGDNVSVRDQRFERLGQRIQSLVAGFQEAQWIEAAIRLEYLVSGCDDENLWRASLSRALNYKQSVGFESRNPTAIVIPLREIAKPSQIAWLFVAHEFQWFEESGFPPVFVEDYGIAGPLNSVSITLQNPPAEWSWSSLFDNLVFKPVYRRHSQNYQKFNLDDFKAQLEEYRHLARLVFEDNFLSILALPVVERWCRALRWETPTRSDLLEEAQTVELRFAVQTSAEPIDRCRVVVGTRAERARRNSRYTRAVEARPTRPQERRPG